MSAERLTGGLLLIQIDGLSRPAFEGALQTGRMPFARELLRDHGYRLHSVFSGVPSTTPSVQGELFYGVRQCVPSWTYLDPASDDVVALFDKEAAARRQEQLEDRSGLLEGGVAYASIFNGGAAETHLCSRDERFLPAFRRAVLTSHFLRRLPKVGLWAAAETLLALGQLATSPETRRAELDYLPKRVAVSALLHNYLRGAVAADLERGVPAIYVNLLDYDCLAHLRGPHEEFALRILPRLDRTLRRWWRASRRANRKYQVWLFSDHGQQPVEPFPEKLADLLEPHPVVAADHGPLAQLYLETEEPDLLAEKLVADGVPQVLYLEEGQAIVRNSQGRFELRAEPQKVVGQNHPFGPAIVEELDKLARHPDAGRLIALGWAPGSSYSFMDELGSHGGPGPEETHAFAMLPADVPLPDTPVLRASHLREAGLRWRNQTGAA